MADIVLERRTFQTGDSIFRQGDSASQAFIIQSGEVDIFKKVDEKVKVLGTIGKGGIFGEMGLIDDAPRMASARAKTGVTLIIVTRQMFEDKLSHADPFIRGMMKIFAETIRTMSSSSDRPTSAAPGSEAPADDAGKEGQAEGSA